LPTGGTSKRAGGGTCPPNIEFLFIYMHRNLPTVLKGPLVFIEISMHFNAYFFQKILARSAAKRGKIEANIAKFVINLSVGTKCKFENEY
jgi:hypothetical protein